jgi:hypothetical protein
VGQLRRELVNFTSWEHRTGKDGKLRRLPTTTAPCPATLDGKAVPEPGFKSGEAVCTAIVGDNADLICHVAKLYLPADAVLGDLTYGNGAWWSKVNLSGCRFFKSDLTTCPTASYDFRHLPYPDSYFDVVAFDPPYMHNPTDPLLEVRYANARTTAGMCHQDIIQLYAAGMREAKRILKTKGTLWVKTADEIESWHQCRSHIEILQIATKLGLIDQDLFVLVRDSQPVVQFKQMHARKNHSFLWVFKKSGRQLK